MGKHTNEAIALAAGLLGQCKGDVQSARRAAGEAHEWLCSIDLDYKPPVAAAPVAVAPVDSGKLAEVQKRLDLALTALDAERKELRTCEQTAEDWKAKYIEANAELNKAKLAKDALVAAAAPLPKPARSTVEIVPVPPGQWLAQQESQPHPAPATEPDHSKANATIAAADPFAHLPPAMREYARQAAAARSSVEID